MFLDPEFVINKDLLESIKSMAFCSICTGILNNPVQCISCENCFCFQCRKDWEKKSTFCPFKCEEGKFKESRLARQILSELILKCPYNCEGKIKYDELEKHFEICEKNLIECPSCFSKVTKLSLKNNKYEQLIKSLQKENENMKIELGLLKKILKGISYLKRREIGSSSELSKFQNNNKTS